MLEQILLEKSKLVKLQPIWAGRAQGMSPFMGISSATFTYVRRVVVLMYFISKVRFDGFDTRI
jgi:hypothetical protein